MNRTPPFPPLEPHDAGWLPLDDRHRMYFESVGNPQGEPLLFLHGGPGSGCSARHRQLFDPGRFRIILFDQRGCGRSTPHGERAANTTAHLVADIATLRRHLGIARWRVSGGSWGAALALAYGASQPRACIDFTLRAPFLTGRPDLVWFFHAVARRHPHAHAELLRALGQPRAVLPALHAALLCDSSAAAAASAWMAWENTLDGNAPFQPPSGEALAQAIRKYRLQAHYLMQHCFLGEARVLAAARQLGGGRLTLLHGLQDQVCRPRNSRLLAQVAPGCRLVWVEAAGHSPYHPGMMAALAEAVRSP